MPLTPGARLGPYEVTGSLGAGGMGEVYRARDSKLGRDVALKIVSDAFAKDRDRRSRFEREARTLAALNHPNIAQIHGLEESGDLRALVLELVEGPTLDEVINGRPGGGGLPLDEALPIARQIAEALEAAHDHGIVHRDLKPANIKVRTDGTVKVLDFGLAKAPQEGDGDRRAAALVENAPTATRPDGITGAGIILGTASYMSPEQARGRPVDRRSDLWAFGCVLFELLTGLRAFAGAGATDTMTAILRDEPDWSALPEDTPPSIRKLLRRCLEKNQAARLDSAAVARLDLDDALSAAKDAARGAQTSPSTPMRRRWSPAWIAAAVAVFVAMAMSIPVVEHWREPPPDLAETRTDIVTPAATDLFSFAISPDGRRVAYVANDRGVSRLWVRSLDSTAAQVLAGTDQALYPFWSPDSRSLGFFADGALQRIDLGGGGPSRLATAPQARGGTWGGHQILFNPDVGPLYRIPDSGGRAEPLTALTTGQATHRFPEFLHDGRHFLYYAQGGEAGIFLGSLDVPTARRLVVAETAGRVLPPDWLLFQRQSALVAQQFDASSGALIGTPMTVADPVIADLGTNVGGFHASLSGTIAYRAGTGGATRRLTWFDRSGRAIGPMGPLREGAALNFPELSPDGLRVGVSYTEQGNVDLYLMDEVRSTRFTVDPSVESRPIWSPDGSRIVFRSSRGDSADLYEKPVDGSRAETRLFGSPRDDSPEDWSPDGGALLFQSLDDTTGADLWLLPLTGDRTPAPWLKTRFNERLGQFSPDGRWVAYQSDESGRNEIWVRPFPGPGGQWMVSAGGGVQPRWRPDGRELYYLAPDGQLMAAALTMRDAAVTVGQPAALFAARVVSSGSTLRHQYDVGPDGRFLMNIAVEDPAAAPMTILLNWRPR